MVASTWKCTDPQWDDVAFNGFEIQLTEAGMTLRQDSYTKDLLARYKDLEGYEEIPAPIQLNAEDFELKDGESAADFVNCPNDGRRATVARWAVSARNPVRG